MLKYTFDYVPSEANPRIHYLKMDGTFAVKPYRYFEGDDTYPNYYRAKWLEFEELIKIIEKLPTIRNRNGDVIRYRIIALHIKFKKLNNKKIPIWTDSVIGPW